MIAAGSDSLPQTAVESCHHCGISTGPIKDRMCQTCAANPPLRRRTLEQKTGEEEPTKKNKRKLYILYSAATEPITVVETFEDAEKAHERLERERMRIAMDDFMDAARSIYDRRNYRPRSEDGDFIRLFTQQAMHSITKSDPTLFKPVTNEEIVEASGAAKLLQLTDLSV